jgi:hypothetical protein
MAYMLYNNVLYEKDEIMDNIVERQYAGIN